MSRLYVDELAEEAAALGEFLPISFRNPDEGEYVSFLWDTFWANLESLKYQFAYLAYHMVMMVFVYFKIWQIRYSLPTEFNNATIGFAKGDERQLLRGRSPFAFSKVNESSVFRILRLIGCGDEKIGVYARLVRDRNGIAHANGNVHFRHAATFEEQVRKILRAVDEIQSCQVSIIEQHYQEFLRNSADPNTREHFDPDEQIREVLIHAYYMSWMDVQVCSRVDIGSLKAGEGHHEIENLHKRVCAMYQDRFDG